MAVRLLFLQTQVGAAVLLILALRPCMRRLPGVCSYLLWLPVFVRLLCPISLETPFGLMPSAAQGEAWLKEVFGQREPMNEGAEIMGADDISHSTADFLASGSGQWSEAGVPGVDSNTEQPDTAGSDSGVDAVYLPAEGSVVYVEPMEQQQPSAAGYILTALWAVGIAVILAYNGVALRLVKRQVTGAEPLRENICVCSQVKAPFTLGLIHPKIYVPDTLAGEELDYIICHEKMHIHRKDYLVKNLAFLVTAVYWFNPLVWTAFYFMERDMEMSCDEAVLREKGEEIKRSYSQSLLNFAGGECPAAVTPLTFGENSVKQRVKNVLRYKEAKKWTLGLGIAVILAVTALLFTVRGVQAQGESRDYDIPVVQSSAQNALDCWAKAFSCRDGNALYQLALDKENFEQWDMVYKLADGSFTFGYSSPWASDYYYEIGGQPAITSATVDFSSEISGQADGISATVIFYMMTSVPEQYLLMEKVKITESEGLYYVDHVSAWDNYVIETGREYLDAYAEGGICDDYDVGYDISFYQQILRHLLANTNPSFYVRYTDPVSAAEGLLHLRGGTGEVTQWEMEPMRTVSNHIVEMPDGTGTMSMPGEGSRATVTYTFWKDGSSVEIPMELKEASQGIWGPAGGGIREAYRYLAEPEMTELSPSGEESPYVIELSNCGIYRMGAASGLTCLWPEAVDPDAEAYFEDGKIYIEDRNAGALFILDPVTGEVEQESLGAY